MEKKDDSPLWGFLAFSSIETRTGAARLIWLSIIFTIYRGLCTSLLKILLSIKFLLKTGAGLQ